MNIFKISLKKYKIVYSQILKLKREQNGILQVFPLLTHRIHVSKLPKSCTKEDLMNHFGTYGPVYSAKIKRDKSKKSKGHGKVTFSNSEGYNASLSQAENHFIHGVQISIQPFLSGENLEKKEINESEKKIVIFGIKFWMKKGYLIKAFKKFGYVSDAELRSGNERKRHAVLTFRKKKEADDAAKKRFHFFENNKFSVSIYDPKAARKKSHKKNIKKSWEHPRVKKYIDTRDNKQNIYSGENMPNELFHKKLHNSKLRTEQRFTRRRGSEIKSLTFSSGREITIFQKYFYPQGALRFQKMQNEITRRVDRDCELYYSSYFDGDYG